MLVYIIPLKSVSRRRRRRRRREQGWGKRRSLFSTLLRLTQ